MSSDTEQDTGRTAEQTRDGRKLRGQRSRDAVVEAILALVRERGEVPAVADVADRSGVSVRSIFRHFDDLESLHAAAVEHQMARVRHLHVPIASDGTVGERVAALAARRAELYEQILPIRPVAERFRGESASITAGLEFSRSALARQVVDLFEAELEVLPIEGRREVLDAVLAATSWTIWHELRVVQDCSAEQARAVVARTVGALLADATR